MEFNPHCSRRNFCCRLLGSLGMLFIGGYRPAGATSPYGRSLERFVPEKLPDELVAKNNPRLVRPQRQLQRFGLTAMHKAVPGPVYTTGGYPVRAVAPGIVHFIGQRTMPVSGPGGYYVRIAHDLYDGLKSPFYPRVTLYRYQAYRSTYYGLQTVRVAHWQSVRRGQVIGRAMPVGAAGEPAIHLVLEERGNPVNPDDWGPAHGFMRYATDDEAPEKSLEEMHRRIERQEQVIDRLHFFYADRSTDDIYRKIHGVIDTEKFTGYPVFWSSVDRLRYLQLRYRNSPHRFPGLSSVAFDALIRSFMENQPIVLDLPLTLPT